ncbi:Stress responsive A/B Barrel Domain [Octadecabacter temperatus]|uniref:Stress responsive A/B Barrel Domain protein n=1 Tax=Octadecabacter temperatus TaxID=1458307 RepID=A0A0K0Y1G0_9RHOB|nr:Dabb family protein [Octadecabacter temperatus]AKS44779.1 Stress responsive A/B Barrel Domain protein [Octadecabacter temperatus]SIO35352.1 Stress responsive A/B Barrel Domain [Octadecabacter temperatus]
MILHAVYLSLPDDADRAELADIMVGLQELIGKIDGFVAFDHGPNIDVEDSSPEVNYGFHGTYVDRAALASYADDPRHQALGGAACGLVWRGG